MDLNSLRNAGNTEDEDEEEEEENEAVMLQSLSLSSAETRNKPPTFAMNFKDVEDSIQSFSGNGLYPIEKWISDFQDLSQLLGWSELHSFIFAKKSLSGIAKLFIQSETGINSWAKLNQALLKEFSSKLNSAQLHDMLSKRRMEKKETVQEYFLVMKELASRGKIEEDALFQYVIDGIQDETNNKMVLYGATNFEEFKKKLKIYEEMKTRIGPRTNPRTSQREEEVKPNDDRRSNRTEMRCFNCGGRGHRSLNCSHKAKGMRCFKCGTFGHKAVDCKDSRSVAKKDESQQNAIGMMTKTDNTHCRSFHKKVTICNETFEALIDTGSAVNVIREDAYEKIESPDLKQIAIQLTGFGGSAIKPLGYFESTITIDEEEFPTRMFVVATNAMGEKVVIGQDLLCRAELRSTQDKTTIHKTRLEPQLMQIDVEDDYKDDKEEYEEDKDVEDDYKDDEEEYEDDYKDDEQEYEDDYEDDYKDDYKDDEDEPTTEMKKSTMKAKKNTKSIMKTMKMDL